MRLKTVAKYSAYTVLGLIGLTIAAVASVVLFVNPNKFKPVIIESVHKATGRTLVMNGDISWQIYPNLGVVIKDISLSNPESFQVGQMLSLKSADVSVALLPLLDNHIVVKSLIIDGLNTSLIQKNGINNWTFVAQAESEASSSGEGKAKPLYLEMTKFSLTNSNIKFDNYDKPQHFALNNANLVVDTKFGGIIKFDQASDLLELSKVSINYNDALVGDIDAKLQNFESPVYSANLDFSTIKINSLAKQFAIKGVPEADFLNKASLSGSINGDINNASIKDFKFNFGEKIKGGISLNLKNFKNPAYSGNLNLEPFNLNSVLDALKIAVPTRKNMPLLNNFAISSKGFSGNMSNINLDGLHLSIGKIVNVDFGALAVKDFAKPSITGSIKLQPLNLNQALDGLNIAKKERNGMTLLNNFAVSSSSFIINMTGTTAENLNSMSFKNLQLDVGNLIKTSFASLAVSQPMSKTPTINATSFNLQPLNLNQALDALNIAKSERKGMSLLNTFSMSSASISGSTSNIALKSVNVAAGGLVKAGFSTLNLVNGATQSASGSVSIPVFSLNKVMQQMGMEPVKIANKHILDNVAINTGFVASANSMKLTNMSALLGKSKIAGNINASSFKPLAVENNVTIDQIDVADFSDINGYKLPISGLKLVGNAKVASSLDMATLNAKQNVSMNQILLRGVNVDKLILQLNDIINSVGKSGGTGLDIVMSSAGAATALNKMKEQVAQYAKPGNKDLSQVTDLGSFSGNALITNGRANPSNFSLSGSTLKMMGNGSVNLAGKREISYKTTSQLLTKGINPIFEKLVVTANVSGSIDDPSASLDWGSLQQQILKYVVQQNKGQIKNAISQQINNAVGGQVNKAVGQQNGNQAVDAVSTGVTNVIGKLFGN
ncbi:MAG: AsmA family protein [Burkholderiales bacterium]|nr:AsmA family protein [Burkholderiales bacterium]